MFSFWKFFIEKRSFSYLLLLVLAGFGVVSLLSIPRESAPEVRVPVGIVTTVLPGASAENIEVLVTDELEQGLINNLDNVDSITSQSREGVSSITVSFDASANLDESLRSLRDEVDRLRTQLPSEAEDPIVSDVNFVDQPILTFAISSTLPDKEFADLARVVQKKVEAVQNVSKVSVSGLRDREISVVVDRAKLDTFGLTLADVTNALATNNIELPLGAISVENIEYSVSFNGKIETATDVADIPIKTFGRSPVYVKDVATIVDNLTKETTFSRISQNSSLSSASLSFNVFKQPGGDITKITKDVRDELALLQEDDILTGAEVLSIYDTGELINEDLTNLSQTGLQTIFLVILVLLLALGWREALIAGLSIPVSFTFAFIGLYLTGNTLNFVSLFALILAVGVIVDAAIVVVEGIHTQMKRWVDKEEASLLTIKEYNIPLLSGTLTTVVVFAALFIVGGVTGEFIASIPSTIIFLLFSSLFVALGVIPLFAASILRRRSTSRLEQLQEEYMEKLKVWYKEKLQQLLGNRRLENYFIGGMIALFFASFALPIVGAIPVVFFSESDADQLIVEIELPEGTPLTRTDIEARKVEEYLYGEPQFESFVTTIGEGSAFGSGGSGSNVANIFVTLSDTREQISSDILSAYAEKLKSITTSTIRISQPSDGPPVGAPILLTLTGDDLETLDAVAQSVASTLKRLPETTNVTTSAKDTGIEFDFVLNKEKAAEFGLDATTIARSLRTAVDGAVATTLSKQGEDIDVRVRLNFNPEQENTPAIPETTTDALRNVTLQTSKGPVLLGTLVDVKIVRKSSSISHKDGKRVVTVSSDLLPGANLTTTTSALTKKLEETHVIPDDVVLAIGGENEDTNEAFRDMFLALIVGIASMLAVLVLQFNSFRYSLYVLSILPFSLIGIFIGLLVSGKAISFPSIMGFVALSGIVVNNSIILIDVINGLRKKNPTMSILDIVLTGSSSRLRPILLTTITTVVGIFPLTFASDLWAPLAYSIMFGLTFSVVITLILIPVIYHRWPGRLPGTKKEEPSHFANNPQTSETLEDFSLT